VSTRRQPTRREQRARRSEAYWNKRMDAAPTPAKRAAVAFDRLRSQVADLPPTVQDAVWQEVIDGLVDATPDAPASRNSQANLHADSSENRAPRPGTRIRARGEGSTTARQYLRQSVLADPLKEHN
jgi:hypothetical protein